MKKILLAFDGGHFSEGAFEFARQMNEFSPVLLTGVFLPHTYYSGLWSYAGGLRGSLFIPVVEDEAVIEIEKNVERFASLCRLHKIEYRVHNDRSDFALPALKKETRFADLLILGSESFYENPGIHDADSYLRDTIHHAECPVLLVPEQFNFPEKNILAYDGSESATYAIKQFAYLFPQLTEKNTVLVYVRQGPDVSFPDEDLIEELCGRHYPNLTLFKLDIDPRKHFALWCNERDGAILVSGAYGRSPFSEAFKKSFVSDILRAHRLPLFIAHC